MAIAHQQALKKSDLIDENLVRNQKARVHSPALIMHEPACFKPGISDAAESTPRERPLASWRLGAD